MSSGWRGSVLIVGASLSGLTTALALARGDRPVTVIERSVRDELESTSGGLGIDPSTLARVIGADPRSRDHPLSMLVDRVRINVAWTDLRQWLLELVHLRDIAVRDPERVVAVSSEPDGGGTAHLASGDRLRADLLIGADGYRSTVRRHIAPGHQSGTYAGYLIWRCLVGESPCSELGVHAGSVDLQVHTSGPFQLVSYAVPGPDCGTTEGRRRLSVAWYDPTRNDMLSAAGCISGDEVVRSLPPTEIPESVGTDLMREAQRRWPDPWPAAVQTALQTKALFATPISEYVPTRLVRGAAALVGDAAHTLTPMTGAGFRSTLEDAKALASALNAGTDLATSLDRYQASRLGAVRALATTGREWSADYLRRTGQLIASDGWR